MPNVLVNMKVVRDNGGIADEIPVILTQFGPLIPLVKYVLKIKQTLSASTITKLMQAASLLLDFMEANHDCCQDGEELLELFKERLETGTIGEGAYDPSGLFWFGRSPMVVNMMKNQLTKFFDWMTDQYGTKPINPWRKATRQASRLPWKTLWWPS